MNALNSLMNPAVVGQAFQQGVQQGRQVRRQSETQNALSQLVTDPGNQEAMQNLARFNPQAAMQMQQRNQQAQREAATNDAMQRALGGDERALDELATLNFDRWKDVSAEQRRQSTEESAVLGQAALSLMNAPAEQRRGLFVRYAQDMPQFAEQIQEVMFLPPAEQDAALRSVIVQAKLVEKWDAMERPRYQAIPEGGTLVNTKDPGAVRQFQAQPSGGLSVVRTGRDASGRRVVELSDGSIQYAD